MSKVIYKYVVNSQQKVITIPFRAQVLTVDYDGNNDLCLWAMHELEDEKDRFVKYEVLVLGTGEQTDEPMNEFDDGSDRFGYMKTIVTESGFVWHIFIRQVYE